MRVSVNRRAEQVSKGAVRAVRSTVDSGSFRRPVVRSGDAVRRPAAAPRLVPCPPAEWVAARANPSPTTAKTKRPRLLVGAFENLNLNLVCYGQTNPEGRARLTRRLIMDLVRIVIFKPSIAQS